MQARAVQAFVSKAKSRLQKLQVSAVIHSSTTIHHPPIYSQELEAEYSEMGVDELITVCSTASNEGELLHSMLALNDLLLNRGNPGHPVSPSGKCTCSGLSHTYLLHTDEKISMNQFTSFEVAQFRSRFIKVMLVHQQVISACSLLTLISTVRPHLYCVSCRADSRQRALPLD